MTEVAGRKENISVGVAPHLKYIAIIGRDYPGFFRLLEQAQLQEGNVGKGEEGPGEEERWDGEEVKKAPTEDPSLKAAWAKAREGSKDTQQRAKSEIEKGTLYRRGVDPNTQEGTTHLTEGHGTSTGA